MKARLPDGRHAGITSHAADRFIERVRPTIENRRAAERELQRLIEQHGRAPASRDAWVRQDGREHVMIGDDFAVVVALEPGQVQPQLVTVIVRGMLSPDVREKRNTGRKGRRRRVAAMRRGRGKTDRRDVSQARQRDDRASG